MKVYFISGLGANCSVFDHLKLPESFEKVYIEWLQPRDEETLQDYALRMATEIDDSEPFVLAGLSFGGIIAQEIAQFKKPEKLFLISTIKSENEIPLLFKFSNYTKAHRYIPMKFITSDSVVSYAFFRKLYSRNLPKINEVFTYRDPKYIRWSFAEILKWKPKPLTLKNVYHFHGDKDPLFPIKKIENPIKINGGNHLMIVMKHKKINEIMNELLGK